MTTAVFRDDGLVDELILERCQTVLVYNQVPGRTLTAGPLACFAT